MRPSIIHSLIVTIGAALIAAVILPSPAAAMKVDEARAICKKHPKTCKEMSGSPGEFCVGKANPQGGCKDVVTCQTADGNCVVVKGAKRQLSSKAVENLLNGIATTTPSKPPRMLGDGILDNRPGFSSHGSPTAIGSPSAAPAAPPPGKIY